jgi:shikimate 5-dehydrogenase
MMKTLKFSIFSVGLYQLSLPLLNLSKSYYDLFYKSTTTTTTDNNHQSYISNGERLRNLYGNTNKKAYAMITGSSDGIGRVMALQMAKYGFNLVLVSRTPEKLERVRDECKRVNS